MFEKMTTGTRILFAFGVAIAISVVVGLAAFVSMEKVTDRLRELADEKFVTQQALADLREATTLAARANSTLQLRRAEGEMRASAHADLESAFKRIDADTEVFQKLPHGERTTRAWNDAQQPLSAWRRAVDEMLRTVAERERLLSQGVGPDDPRVKALDERNWAQFHEVRERFKAAGPALGAVLESNAKNVEIAKQAGHDAASGGIATILVAIAIGAVVSLVIGLLLARSIRAAIRGLLTEAGKLTEAVEHGKLDVRASVDSVSFEFRPVVEGMNETVDAFVQPIRATAENMSRIERGDVPPPMTADYKGEFASVKASVNGLIEMVNRRAKDIDMLLAAAVEGRLDVRADPSKYQGGNARVIAGMNSMLEAIAVPVAETAGVLSRLAERDLTRRIQGDYKGEFSKMKEAVNAAAQSLHDALAQVAQAVEEVSSASSQIASSSQAVANGASEQASALEETSSSLESMAGMTKQSADNAQQASGLAGSARSAATEGSTAMEQMTEAMGKIKTSAEGTSQIIKDINEIAFQTNLLALNAAVEAARAGEAGRGFAVVAEEVRSLALRSKEAANKTEELIRQSVREAGEGEVTAKRVNDKLSEIVGSVSKVTDIVAEIAASAKEQAAGIDQVATAVGEMDKVTQQNAASSEESSSAATELAGQSQELAAMIGSFRLEHGRAAVAKKPSAIAGPKVKPAPARKPTDNGKHGTNGMALKPADLIPLNDEHVPGEF